MPASLLAASAIYFANKSSVNRKLRTQVPKTFLALRSLTLSNCVLFEVFK